MDVTIGGIEITFDLELITITEYRKFATGALLSADDDEILARVCGQPVEWVGGLSQPSYRRLTAAFFKKAREPLSDPN
jgi:hypothetical protein